MSTSTEAQEAGADPPLSADAAPQGPDGGIENAEYVELSEAEQKSLHRVLHMAYATAPEESGAIDSALDADAWVSEPCPLRRRAELVGVTRSEWAEISQWSTSAIEELLRTEERSNSPGGGSSAA